MNISAKLTVISIGLSIFIGGPALAKKPDHEDYIGHNYSTGYKDKHHDDHDHHKGKKYDKYQGSSYFNLDRKKKVYVYYQEKKTKHCPPGLAKKGNACIPKGLAKKWAKGQPLPANVVYYNLPNNLLYELGQTPRGQKLVRVGEDILLINAVTGLVIDAIEQVFQ